MEFDKLFRVTQCLLEIRVDMLACYLKDSVADWWQTYQAIHGDEDLTWGILRNL